VLEKRFVPPSAAMGLGYLGGTTAISAGQFVAASGTFSAAVNSGKPNYAESGDFKWVIADSGVCAIASGYALVGVADKLNYRSDSSDLTLDSIATGLGIIVYTEGTFDTDVYGTIADATVIGTQLYLDANGKLTTTRSASDQVPRATFLGKKTSGNFDSNYQATGWVMFKILPGTPIA
jgi:hypothetical protein